MRIRTLAAAFAVVMSTTPAAAAQPDATGTLTPFDTGVPFRHFGPGDLEAAVVAVHTHYMRGAAHVAERGYGSIQVPSIEAIRNDLEPSFHIAAGGERPSGSDRAAGDASQDPIEDVLDESKDTEQTTSTTVADATAHCSVSIYAFGSKIFGIPVYRHLRLETVNSCSGGFIVVCVTKAVTVSNQPLMLGIGIGEGSSQGCFNRTNNSGFAPKPAPVVGVNTIVYTDSGGVGVAPFAFLA